MDKTNSVKEMLVMGTTPEDLLNSLREEIEKAQAEIDIEKAAIAEAKASDLAIARDELANALLQYIAALDIMPAELVNEISTDEIAELIESLEDQFKAYAAIATFAASLGVEPKPASRGKRAEVCKCKEIAPEDEEIIREFLKSLR